MTEMNALDEGWQTFHGKMLNWFPTKRRLGKIKRRVPQDDYMEFGAAYCLPGAEKKLEQQSKERNSTPGGLSYKITRSLLPQSK